MKLDCGCNSEHPRCPACKAERRRLRALHNTAGRPAADDPDAPERARRVVVYRRRFEQKLPIFQEES